MIDEVHMLTNAAFNAMLKTLEEPPEYLKFVLATTDPQKVPVTVLSRCLQFNLRPMAPETVFEHLTRVLAAESLAAEPAALRLLARAARGSMRDALSLTDQAIAFGGGQLLEAGVRQMLGSVDRSHVFQLIRALADADGASVVSLVDALRLHGVSAAATLEDMSTLLQRMAVMQAVPGLTPDADDPDASTLADLAERMSAEETQLLYSLCLHGRTELGLAPDEYAALTMVLLRLLAFKPASGSAQKKSPALTARAESARLAPAAPAASVAPASPTPPMAPQAQPATAAHAVAPAASARPQASPATAPALAPQAPAARMPRAPAPLQPSHHLPELDAQPSVDEMLAELDEPPMDLPPWEDLAEETPSTASAVAPAIRSLPVREAPMPSNRVDALKRPEVPLQPTPEGDFWAEVVRALVASDAITALVRELALQSQLLAKDADPWRLRVERESLNMPSTRERLQAALQAAGHDVRLTVELGPVVDSPAKRLAVAAAAKMEAAEALIQSDPLVQTMIRDFGARIVPGSIQAF
jgi:DNA polymerase-3 subunit gamma/tau